MNNKTHTTILLVEDEAIIAMAEAQTVRGFGYEVVIANSGEEAVRLAAEDAGISLVLMDIDLGKGIDGPGAAQQILAGRNVPIVFLTSHAEKEYVDRVKEITRYGYVIKNSGNFVLQSSMEMAFELFEAHENLRIQHRLGLSLNSTTDLKRGIDEVLNVVLQFEGVDGGGVYMADPVGGSLDLITCRGVSQEFIESVSHYDRDSPNMHMAMAGRAMYGTYHDILPYADDILMKEGLRAMAVIPVMSQGELIAVMNLCSHSRDSFSKNTRIALETLASNVGSAFMRLRANIARREIDERFQRLTENMNDIVSEVDANGIIRYISPSHRRIFGRDPEELVGSSVFDGVHPDDREQLVAIYNEAARLKEDRESEYRYRHGDGPYVWLRSSGHPLYDETGEHSGAIFSSNDITRRKKAEDEAREGMEKYRSLVENLNDVILTLDENGTITYMSPAIERVSHYSAGELTGRKMTEFIHPDDQAGLADSFNRIFEGKQKPYEFRVIDKDGTVRYAQTSSILTKKDGKTVGITTIMTDISKRRFAEEKIRNLLAEKEILLREVHHRIKNNMSTMASMLSLQSRTLKDPSAVAALKDAEQRMQSMELLYDKLYRSENLRDMPVRAYLGPLVDEIVGNFPNSSAVRVEKHIDDFILGVAVLSNLGIIVNEILSNAMKYAFTGRADGVITVSASATGDRVTIIIGDNGHGIPESVDIGSSSGFGLMLVGMLMKQLRGSIRIERGQGTRFVLEFGM